MTLQSHYSFSPHTSHLWHHLTGGLGNVKQQEPTGSSLTYDTKTINALGSTIRSFQRFFWVWNYRINTNIWKMKILNFTENEDTTISFFMIFGSGYVLMFSSPWGMIVCRGEKSIFVLSRMSIALWHGCYGKVATFKDDVPPCRVCRL